MIGNVIAGCLVAISICTLFVQVKNDRTEWEVQTKCEVVGGLTIKTTDNKVVCIDAKIIKEIK